MAKIVITIEKCNECPFVNTKLVPTSDPFDEEYDYSCGKNGRIIERYVERISELPEVPNWCPCLDK